MSLALVFPGHGSQLVGMLDAFSHRPEVKETIEEVSDVLNQDFGALIAAGPKEKLSELRNVAPAMVTTGLACYRVWLAEGGPKPNIVAGHSHGEYTALVAAGVLSLKDAVLSVRYRAESILETVPAGIGGMAAIIGLSKSTVIEFCNEVSSKTQKIIETVNFNAPGQLIISGEKNALAEVCKLCENAGAKMIIPLAVNFPLHSSFLTPVTGKLKNYFENIEFRKPNLPVINNVDVSIIDHPDDIKDAMARQVARPVRWWDVVKKMSNKGVKHVVECSPGKILSDTISRIDENMQGSSLVDEIHLQDIIQKLK